MIQVIKKFLLSLAIAVAPLSASSLNEPEPVVILGGGVGSMTSALYLGRAGLSPLVIEGPTPGGLLTQSHLVQNWPGEMEIEGAKLTDKMKAQAEASGARFLSEEVVAVDFSEKPLKITTRSLDGSNKQRQIYASSCIVAMGTQPNFLGVKGEKDFWGNGVTNCAICDGSLYKDKVVAVVGGGDAAIIEALYLSNIAKEVYILVRKDNLKAMEEKRAATLKEKSNVHFLYQTEVDEVKGDANGVKEVVLKTKKGKEILPIDGLFLAIGSTPNSKLFQNALKLDKEGYILLEKDQKTSLNGVYAIGDIVDPVYKQAVSAAGDGAKAALQVQQYLSDKENKLVVKAPSSEPPLKKAEKTVIEVNSLEEFQNELEQSTVPVLVDFYATWCGPCKRVSPLIDESAVSLSGKVKFLKVNVDKLGDLSTSYNVRAMPTVLLLEPNGTEIERKVGLNQIADLLKYLESEKVLLSPSQTLP